MPWRRIWGAETTIKLLKILAIVDETSIHNIGEIITLVTVFEVDWSVGGVEENILWHISALVAEFI
jgi:hypothetical protein